MHDSPGLPFAHINLRHNPFGEVDIHRRPEFAVVDLRDWVERLVGRTAVQFMGDKGRGKTTHLVVLLGRFESAAYVHIPEGRHPVIPVGQPLFIDEIQRVSWHGRRRIYKRGVPLVLGTHRDFAPELVRHGYDVTTVHPAANLDVELLLLIANRRIDWSRRGAGAVPRIMRSTAEALLERYGSDLRAIEGDLYHRFQKLGCISDV